MRRGKVIFYNKKSKIGRVKDYDNNEDYYFRNPGESLRKDDSICYELKKLKRGTSAVSIRKITDFSE